LLQILGVFEMVDHQQNKNYILSTQDSVVGGLSKWVDTTPDPLHTYMGELALLYLCMCELYSTLVFVYSETLI
jgi:geranylgeranyl transferase type-1 subunit beta